MGDRDILPDMSEEVIRDIFRMDILDSDVHVYAGLNVIWWNVGLLEIVGSATHTV